MEFYGEDASLSKDHARVVNQNHLNRLRRLLEEESVPETVVHGGKINESTL